MTRFFMSRRPVDISIIHFSGYGYKCPPVIYNLVQRLKSVVVLFKLKTDLSSLNELNIK